ncbi:MAG: aminotransferase class III-fold pyridoxal phosphate-dependent enzyme, partial [Thermoplasmata archaeon]
LHFGTASQYYKVKPDLIILGKIIGGGLPFALFGGRKDIMEMISPLGKVYQAGTYSGNPLSVTAGIATLNSLKTKDYNLFYEYLKIIEKYVNDAKEDFNSKVVLNGLGGMFQIFFNDIVRNNEEAMKSDSKTYFELFKYFLKKSIYVPPSQFESLFFSFKHKKNEINKLGMTIYEFLRENKNRI